MLSEAKMARPVNLPTRSSASSKVASGRPINQRRAKARARPKRPCGSNASSRGTSDPVLARRKCGWILTRRYWSPGWAPRTTSICSSSVLFSELASRRVLVGGAPVPSGGSVIYHPGLADRGVPPPAQAKRNRGADRLNQAAAEIGHEQAHEGAQDDSNQSAH